MLSTLNFVTSGNSLAEAKKYTKQHAWCQKCALQLYVKFNIGESDSEKNAKGS